MGREGDDRTRRFDAALISARLRKRAEQGLRRVVLWSRANALSIWPYGTSCCGESLRSIAERADLASEGVEISDSWRQADVLVVSGSVTLKSLPAVLETYDEMPEPKWVVCLGDGSSGDGTLASYALAGGMNDVLPVDVHVPRCPPSPETLLEGIRQIRRSIVAAGVDRQKSDDDEVAVEQVGLEAVSSERLDSGAADMDAADRKDVENVDTANPG